MMIANITIGLRQPPRNFSVPHMQVVPRRHFLTIAAGLQRPLTSGERKEKRATAARLGKDIVLIQLGNKGVTPAFLEGLGSALAANELVKVRVGSDVEMAEAGEELAEAADCVVVHKIGRVLTLYRDKSLACVAADGTGEAEIDPLDLGEDKKKRKKRRPPVVREGPPPPPEFTVIN